MSQVPASERRERLVEAALEVIGAEGMAAASVRTISARAGMPAGAFHYVFRDKDELLEQLVAELPETLLAAALPAVAIGSDLATTLRAGYQAPLQVWMASPARHLALIELTVYALRTPTLHDLARRQYDRYFAAVESFLEAVADHFAVEFVPSTSVCAQLATSVLDGVTLSWLALRDDDAALAVLAAAGDAAVALTRPRPG